MLEKVRKPGNTRGHFTVKNITAWFLFGCIILVFVFFGFEQGPGLGSGGVAAVVNDTSISIAEYRQRVQNLEQNTRSRFDQLPADRRQDMMRELRSRTLEGMIMDEIVFQEARKRGVSAADGEVRDQILQIPVFVEGGRFKKDRYEMYLSQMGISVADFERQIRKQIVTEKLQELFVGSAAPAQEELKRGRQLAGQKLSLRFIEFGQDDLSKPGIISEAEVQKFESESAAAIEKYHKENLVEFSKPERVQARHILLRSGEKRSEDEALKAITELKKKATPQNFAKLATDNSEDPGSKAKGGDLGEFDRGRMMPEFEEAAFGLKEGQISEPVKTSFGYHLILTEKKFPASVEPLEKVKRDIARKLVSDSRQSEILAGFRTTVEKGSKKEIDTFAQKAGLKWNDTGEFDLATPAIPKIGDNAELMAAVLKNGRSGGLVPKLVESSGRYFVAEATPWKSTATPVEVEGADRMAAFRKSSDLIDAWANSAKEKAQVERNNQLLQ